jgi:hypothetical protein
LWLFFVSSLTKEICIDIAKRARNQHKLTDLDHQAVLEIDATRHLLAVLLPDAVQLKLVFVEALFFLVVD